MKKAIETCPLCSQDDRPPLAPIISLATRVYLTLPTQPQLTKQSVMIVPIAHRTNTLECDEDEWQEIRVCSQFLK